MENIKKGVKIFFVSFFNILKKTLNFIKNSNWKNVRKFLGIFSMIFSGLGIFLEIIFLILVSLDPLQLQKILNSFFDFQLFNYINLIEYYSIIFGDFFMDMTFYFLILILGVWLYNGKNFLKNIKIRIILLSFLSVGTVLFSFGIYYAMPEIKEPIKKVISKFNHKCGYEHKNNFHQNKQKKYFDNNKRFKLYKEKENEQLSTESEWQTTSSGLRYQIIENID